MSRPERNRPSALSACVAAILCSALPAAVQAQSAQNPSPMVENTRAHERLAPAHLEGSVRQVVGPDGEAIELFVPAGTLVSEPITIVVHFHGAAWVSHQAVAVLGHNAISAVSNLGSGSSVYDRAYSDPAAFRNLLRSITEEVSVLLSGEVRIGSVVLSAFSAGHGAVRAILRDPDGFSAVAAVLLLDGMHTSYIPERRVLADSGSIDTGNLQEFAAFARAAMSGDKRFMVTHSSIFPGTFASTTETADWLLAELGLRRVAVLEWGPRGMQQLSHARAGGFELIGFAGNSAPDHVDHFHAMPELLVRLLQ